MVFDRCIKFTHLVHLPAAYASKTVLWIYALRSFNEISLRLGSFETVRRAFKIVRRTLKNIWCVIAAIADMVAVEMMTNLLEKHLKVLFKDRRNDSSCCRQIRRRIGCRYWVQIYLSENRYILADKDRRSISITHTPKQYNHRIDINCQPNWR